MSAERSGPAICNVSNIGEGKDEMTKASIDLQDLRRRLYVKEKAEPSGGSEDLLRNERASAGNDGIGGGCTTLEDCLTPIECDATGRKSPQQDRSHKRWREANGGAPKASRLFLFFLARSECRLPTRCSSLLARCRCYRFDLFFFRLFRFSIPFLLAFSHAILHELMVKLPRLGAPN